MTDVTKSASFSKAHRPRHPQGVDPDDPEYFGSVGSGNRASAFHDDPVVSKLPGGPPIHRDSKGDVCFSEGITAPAQEVADKIRSRTKDIREPTDARDLSISSEKHQHSR
jgi:hypothetical protein